MKPSKCKAVVLMMIRLTTCMMQVLSRESSIRSSLAVFYTSGGDYPKHYSDSQGAASELLNLLKQGYFKPEGSWRHR